jgi:pyrrolidone-carboxylate peptidase
MKILLTGFKPFGGIAFNPAVGLELVTAILSVDRARGLVE